MPTEMTADQVRALRDAGVATELEGSCTSVVRELDKHGLTLDWAKFVAAVAPDPAPFLLHVRTFVACLNPPP